MPLSKQSAISAIVATCFAFVLTAPTYGQFFSQVINVPEDQSSITSDIFDFGTQVNLSSGGTISNNRFLQIGEINITGGAVGTGAFIQGKVNISGGGVGDNFSHEDDLLITGGTIGNDFSQLGTNMVAILGGAIGNDANILDSNLEIQGGSIGDNLSLLGNFTTITGGNIGNGLVVGLGAFQGDRLDFIGGTIGNDITVEGASVFSFRGGSLGDNFSLIENSELNIFGSDFTLDGQNVSGLLLDQAVELSDRDVTLAGTLADGSTFAFDLNSVDNGGDFFEAGSTVTLTQLTVAAVPEPTSLVLLGLGCLSLGIRRRKVC